MKSFNIHHLTLIMVTMTGMMFAAPLKPPNLTLLLKQILDEADTVSKNVPLNTTVIKIPMRRVTCEHIFCKAEEVLKLTPTDRYHSYERLTQALHNYNNETKSPGCHVDVNHTCELKAFVDELVACVEYALKQH